MSEAATGELLKSPELWAGEDIPFLPWGAGATQLIAYIDTLLKWNRVLNLSGCRTSMQCLQELVQDSFYLGMIIRRLAPAPNIWDLGAGAGLPGIPLRIFFSEGNYTMIERNAKRCTFLSNILAQLKLPRTKIWHGQVETCFRNGAAAPPDIILSRAFMPWQKLLPLIQPFLPPGSHLLIMANEPPPVSFPDSWRLTSLCEYRPANKQRWIWGLGGV